MAAINGVLDEERGSCLMLLLDMSRYLVNKITHEHKFDSLDDVTSLHTSRMDIVCELSAKMWSYWHSAPKGPGVYEMLLDWMRQQHNARANITADLGAPQTGETCDTRLFKTLHFIASHELKTWPRQRVSGVFYLVETPAVDGASLLVDESLKNVYKVLGNKITLRDLVLKNSQSFPACLMLTLLPFVGEIVYDGTIRGSPEPLGPQLIAEINAVVAAAAQSGCVISALPALVDAPLVGSYVYISELKARPDLNGLVAFAGEFDPEKGRYNVRTPGGGVEVLLRPTNLRAATEAEIDAAAPPGTLLGSALTQFQQEVQDFVRAIPEWPNVGEPGDDGSFWVFQRVGYTERDNPGHNFMIMAGSMPLPATDVGAGASDGGMTSMMTDPEHFWHRSEALVPIVDEILAAFRQALMSKAWAGRSKPKQIAVDAKEIVDRLEEILEPAGVVAGYYPPPSSEELVSIGHMP